MHAHTHTHTHTQRLNNCVHLLTVASEGLLNDLNYWCLNHSQLIIEILVKFHVSTHYCIIYQNNITMECHNTYSSLDTPYWKGRTDQPTIPAFIKRVKCKTKLVMARHGVIVKVIKNYIFLDNSNSNRKLKKLR